jgi:hypothetical protein
MTHEARSRTALIFGLLFVTSLLFLKFKARGDVSIVEWNVQSRDGRCVCWLTEYDEPKDGRRTLDLRITLDGETVQTRSYLGNKRTGDAVDQFAIGQKGPFYYLYVDGLPEYAVAAIDGGNGVVWFQSSNGRNEYIYQVFQSTTGKPRLTDLNWLNAFVLND